MLEDKEEEEEEEELDVTLEDVEDAEEEEISELWDTWDGELSLSQRDVRTCDGQRKKLLLSSSSQVGGAPHSAGVAAVCKLTPFCCQVGLDSELHGARQQRSVHLKQRSEELRERLMVSEATVQAQAEQLKDYRELLSECSPPSPVTGESNRLSNTRPVCAFSRDSSAAGQ